MRNGKNLQFYTRFEDLRAVSLAIAYKSVSLKTIYTQFSESALQNFIFAYNRRGISVPVTLKMEITYSFIRDSRICELSISYLRTDQFLLKLFIRNPTKGFRRISLLRIKKSASPSLQHFLYAVIKFAFFKSLVCV